MTRLRAWLRSSRGLVILFVVVTILPALGLVALGARLLEQEKVLAGQRRREALEGAAERATRLVDQQLARMQQRLANSGWKSNELPSGSVLLTFGVNRVEVVPAGRLPYLPVSAKLREMPEHEFVESDSVEFAQGSIGKALDLNRRLGASGDSAVRAGALLREGRILRKLGRGKEALAAYQRLSEIQGVGLSGIPIDLVARRSRCSILEEMALPDAAKQEAERIAAGLRRGQWMLDRSSYEHVTGQITHWLGAPYQNSPDDDALAAAADWMYRRWANGDGEIEAEGRRSQFFDGRPVLVVWSIRDQRMNLMLAGWRYVQDEIAASVRKSLAPVHLTLADENVRMPNGAARVRKSANETGLPWALMVEDSGLPAGDLMRWRLWQLGFVTLMILVGAGSYLIWRAVDRELTVARLQSDFVSAVSHEFRTPLTSMRHVNDLLSDAEEPPAEKRRNYYRAQARATERLHHLVESLLDFGRMEAGKQPYHFQPLDAGALARDVVEEFAGDVEERGINVDYHLDSDDCPVRADPDALARALWNLLDNAAKYGGGDGIEVVAGRAGGFVSIGVRDRGPGVPPHEQQTIFDKFVRGETAKSSGIRGTGLGLAMVSHIVRAHGGEVRLSSKPGQGSTFTIVLPERQ